MNKQIKELYTQVCMEQNLPFTVEHNSAVMLDAFANKFAELIVWECISIADKESERYSNLDQEYCSMAMDNYRELVRQHFGVEE